MLPAAPGARAESTSKSAAASDPTTDQPGSGPRGSESSGRGAHRDFCHHRLLVTVVGPLFRAANRDVAHGGVDVSARGCQCLNRCDVLQ